MSQEISVELVCIVIRGGIEIWVEKDRAEKLKMLLTTTNCPQFIEYEGKLINKADITGIFDALTMSEKTRRKNGEWQCKYSTWHERFGKCNCRDLYDIEQKAYDEEYFKKYGYYPLR